MECHIINDNIQKIILDSIKINECNTIVFDENINCIEINLNDSGNEYYNCVIALNNLPFNLKNLIINIKEKNKVSSTKHTSFISRNGQIISRHYLNVDLELFNLKKTNSYTLDELIMKIKIPYGCIFTVNGQLIY